jgi:hypothetical protein
VAGAAEGAQAGHDACARSSLACMLVYWRRRSVSAAEGLYRLVDAAYEKRSIAVSSNLHPSKAHLFANLCEVTPKFHRFAVILTGQPML